MKKILAILLTAAMAVGMVSCGSSPSSSAPAAPVSSDAQPSEEGASTPSTDKVYNIGVIQLLPHTALDAAYEGFVDGLKEAGYEDGKNIKITYQNAQGEQSNCVTIADKLINDKNDLILAIATPAAQAVANKTKDIPILVTAVTDPADAQLVASNEAPGGNVSGTSDLNPIKEQMELLTAKEVETLHRALRILDEYEQGMKSERISAVDAQNAWLRAHFQELVNTRQQCVEVLHHALSRAFSFTEDCFGREQEMILLVTGLTRNDRAMEFIRLCGCTEYLEFAGVLLPEDTDELQRQAEALLRSEQKERP